MNSPDFSINITIESHHHKNERSELTTALSRETNINTFATKSKSLNFYTNNNLLLDKQITMEKNNGSFNWFEKISALILALIVTKHAVKAVKKVKVKNVPFKPWMFLLTAVIMIVIAIAQGFDIHNSGDVFVFVVVALIYLFIIIPLLNEK